MSIRHEGFKCIGRRDGDYYFAQSVFQHRDDFQGATGSVVRPVSADEYEYASDPENVAERYYDCWIGQFGSAGSPHCEECEGHPHSERGCDSCNVPSLDAWIALAINSDGIDHLMFDGSDGCDASAAFDEMGIDHESTDCIGGGRCFTDADRGNWDEVYDRKALVALMALEDGAVDVDYAAAIVFGR